MSYIVGELMRLFSPAQLDVDTPSTLSEKRWTGDYPPLKRARVRTWPPTRRSLQDFLSPEDVPTVADSVGLSTPAHMLNTQQLQLMTEGDVTHDFDQNIIPFVELSFSGPSALSIPAAGAAPLCGGPKLWPRSLVASKNSSSSKKLVDYQMTMSHEIQSLEAPAMIGELKRSRIIKRREWAFEAQPSDTTIRLMQEARGYAHLYECPQVFLFDSKTLVLVQYCASTVEEIADANCFVDICIIPRETISQSLDQCSMAEGLRALALRGFTRLCATRSSVETEQGKYNMMPIPLSIGEHERVYEFYSGRPFWKDRYGQIHRHHPHEYRRDLAITVHGNQVSGHWIWLDENRRQVAIDTENCFV